MPDREKVIRAWECCNPFNRKCNECPYEKDCYHDGISRHMVADAIAMLKEQDKRINMKQRRIDQLCKQLTDLKHRFHEKTELIRCKDCKNARRMCQPWNDLVCEKNGQVNKPDWFCADGERKSE